MSSKSTFYIEICIDNDILNSIKIPLNDTLYFESGLSVFDLDDNEIGRLEGIFCSGRESEVKSKILKYQAGLKILRFFQIHKNNFKWII